MAYGDMMASFKGKNKKKLLFIFTLETNEYPKL
jgi:hypothetical protein